MITLKVQGDYKKTTKYLNFLVNRQYLKNLDRYGQLGLDALQKATPVDTGKTAKSWSYRVNYNKGSVSIVWSNSNTSNGIPIVILIQYGHATKNGHYVQGVDFINPALRPIFEEISKEVWEEVTNA